MLSQVKPHFIYNSISAIIDLCAGNPEAQNALVAFSDYLRVNLGAKNPKALISFETELKHIKHYLYLEKLRFEERLQVIYDIKAIDFKVPILSIQPIVENAVSHGLFNKPGGGTIRIRTKETENEYIITIVDDGIGYDPEVIQKSGTTQPGIENARNRLSSLCRGTLEITSRTDIGTRVNITIPKEEIHI